MKIKHKEKTEWPKNRNEHIEIDGSQTYSSK